MDQKNLLMYQKRRGDQVLCQNRRW